jgi:hypothetical protein
VTQRPSRLSRAISNTWKKIVPNFNARWLAPWWVSQSEKGEALIRARTLQANRDDPVTVRPDVLFIHVPKAAGTSILALLSDCIGMKKYIVFEKLVKKSDDELAQLKNISFGHITPDALFELGVFSSTQLESAFSFGFVRNPYDRAVSLFAYLRRQRAIPNLWSFDSFLRAIAREKPEAGLWNVIGLSQAAPMVEWMRPRTWQGPTLTLKFEDLEGSLRELSAYLPIPPQLPHLNPSRRARQPVVVSPRGLDFIKEFYSEDFAAFDYSLDLPEGLFALKK